MITILGAGIAGISAAYHFGLINKKAVIFEKNGTWGGLCDNFSKDGFLFDNCIHLSFTENEYVKDLFSRSSEYYSHRPVSYNYYEGCWIKHPVQNNLCVLPVDTKVKVIKSFLEKKSGRKPKNYEDWLNAQYGKYFSENFPMKYTRKYWTCEAKGLNTDWVGSRMYRPNIDEILRGAFSEETEEVYYAKEMRYPKEGGYKSFVRYMAERCDINMNKTVVEIDVRHKFVVFQDGTKVDYEILISSLPLPELISMIGAAPKSVKASASALVATQAYLVSIGFNRPDVAKHLWFYIYDEDILPSRVWSPNLKSPNNVPDGCSSLQFEIYSSRLKPLNYSEDYMNEHVVEKGIKMGLFSRADIKILHYKKLNYANIIFDHQISKSRQCVHAYLDAVGIKCIGRFGLWDYLWSDQSLLSGKTIVDEVR